MSNKIIGNVHGQPVELIIHKFKAVESLDFIVDIINYLPEYINLPGKDENGKSYTIERDLIKYIIFLMMDVGEDIKITDEQKDLINDITKLNIIELMFREAYINSNAQIRKDIRERLTSVLKFSKGDPFAGDLDLYFDSNKKIFSALISIVRYNYADFFLINEI